MATFLRRCNRQEGRLRRTPNPRRRGPGRRPKGRNCSWRLDTYRSNPVFQNAHNYGDILFTLGKAVSTEVLSVGGAAALCQRIQFATDVNPVARIAYGLYKGGFLNAVSVGFIPLRWEDSPSQSFSSSIRRRYLEQELLEVSAVSIPANPNALTLGLKEGVIERGDLEELLGMLKELTQ